MIIIIIIISCLATPNGWKNAYIQIVMSYLMLTRPRPQKEILKRCSHFQQ